MAQADRTLEALARDRGPDLLAYATLLTGGDRAAAQDLVQDAIVKVFGRMRAGFTPDVAEAYVRRTILTLYVDAFRRRRGWSAVRHLVAVPDAGPAPHAEAESLDLRAALRDLAPQERAVVVLRFYEDLTVPDVADRMGLAEGTVKRYLSNALHKLGARLGPLAEADDAAPVPVVVPRRTPRRTPERSGR
ncbi:MAG: sigma-70 family RNA polymerase sigma factor [Actinomycetales bacterium]|nr:sigma-70 family RNA polymerase sigma factor [Actinomycetales bacterium]